MIEQQGGDVMFLKFIATVLIGSCFAASAYAGWLDNAVQNAVKDQGVNVVNGAKSSNTNTPSANNSAQADSGAPTNEEAYSKYDFVPGDKVIFYDDFSDTDEGEFPIKWTLKGFPTRDNRNNAVEVVSYNKQHFLRSQPAAKNEYQSRATQYIRLNMKGGDMPEKFTVEFDAVLGQGNLYNQYYLLLGNDKSELPGSGANISALNFNKGYGSSANTKTAVNKNDGKIHHIAVSVNGTFVKAYIDNERVVNDPDGIKRPIKYIGMVMETNNSAPSDNLMFSNIRIAEGGKKIASALSTDGKIVTHGILFDPGSDTIRPESVATLRMILGLLNDDPDLKFSIEGHTDNQGSSSTSQPLSEKRAIAVKNWLVAKGISADRLQAKGWGEAKPIDTNATTEGKANNRRVEFVKI
jgi:outer membrane protein OmpA-like peptidoglycan-associated protein